jgi:hypothetical protein
MWAAAEHVEGARCDRCLFDRSVEFVTRRRADIASLRALAPNSLGVQALAAEDRDLEDFLARLNAIAAARAAPKGRGSSPSRDTRSQAPAHVPATESGVESAATSAATPATTPNAAAARHFFLEEPLRSACAARVGGSVHTGKIIRRLGGCEASSINPKP